MSKRIRGRQRKVTLVILLACALLGWMIPSFAAPPPAQTTAVAGVGISTPIAHWEIQTSATADDGGQAISQAGYSTQGWYPVGARATVMAGMIANGKPALLEDGAGKLSQPLFYGLNLQRVGRGRHFAVPWWYRATFQLHGDATTLHTFIKVNGIIPAADLWLNGKEIATRKTIAGAYTSHALDVSRWVHPGLNVLAVKVYPASPERNLILSWVDWNPAPPDNNMGIWREVDVIRTGPVSLRGLHVISKLDLPDMQHAEVTIKARLLNNTARAQDVSVTARVAGIALTRTVHLDPRASESVVFSPENEPGLRINHPDVWWPIGMGAHPLYHVAMTAKIGNDVSDRAHATFGIRDVTSRLTAQGYRQFVINGKPLLIRGGGWAPDMFLREQPKRLAAEFGYIRNLGLNAIRSEGKLERPDFYRLADREGILILPGWECCSKWEAAAKTGGEPWDGEDFKVATESMESEARRLRDHPSVIAFLIGSDNAPPPKVARAYVAALRAADWPDPIISAASDQKTEAAGPSGMKMSGPYAWVPPNYWYADKAGGAFGFNSETSAGIDIPRVSSLEAMLTPQALLALWKYPDVRQYHAAPFWSPFSSLERFDTALASRYGPPKNLRDYVEKAQLANYEAVRAQFEAYNAHMDAADPSTGVIYWMLDNAWPSLHWHLIDYDLNPAGAYFGAQEANQPVHIQYSYNDRSVMGINHTLHDERDLRATVRVYDLDGKELYSHALSNINLPANHAKRLATVPALADLSSTYFIELDLTAADGREVSRNVYWLADQADELDWARSNWYTTPVIRYANLTALQQLPPATVTASADTRQDGQRVSTTVTITAARSSKAVAFFLHLSILQPGSGRPLLPVTWSSNDVTLWPGESVTLTARYELTGQSPPAVKLSGWNVAARTIADSIATAARTAQPMHSGEGPSATPHQ